MENILYSWHRVPVWDHNCVGFAVVSCHSPCAVLLAHHVESAGQITVRWMRESMVQHESEVVLCRLKLLSREAAGAMADWKAGGDDVVRNRCRRASAWRRSSVLQILEVENNLRDSGDIRAHAGRYYIGYAMRSRVVHYSVNFELHSAVL